MALWTTSTGKIGRGCMATGLVAVVASSLPPTGSPLRSCHGKGQTPWREELEPVRSGKGVEVI